jgi:hypothetical protein
MPACVADSDPVTPQVDPDCVLTEHSLEGDAFTKTDIPPCSDTAGTLPVGTDVCYVALGDSNGDTPTGADDISPACADDGWNLEFRIVRKQGVPAPEGTQISATCALSLDPDIDCPNLP